MACAKENKNDWYGWVVVFSAFMVYFIVDGVLFSFGVLLVEILEEFGESVATSAALGGIFLGFTSITSPIAGSLSDAFGRRPASLIGATLFSCGLFTSTFAASIAWLYLTFGVLGGTGFGLMCIASEASVIEHFPSEQKGLATGIAVCGAGVGIFVMSQVTSYLLDAFGLRGTFLVLSGIMLNGIPCGLIFREPPQASTEKDTGTQSINSNEMSTLSLKKKLKHIFIDIILKENAAIFRDFRRSVFLLSAFTCGLAFFVPFAFLPEQAVEMGIGQSTAAWLTSALGLSNTLGRVSLGWLGSRSFIRRTFLLKIIIFMSAISLPASLLLTTFETKLVFAACYGFLFGGFRVTAPLALVEMVPTDRIGKTVGMFLFLSTAGNVIGSLISGWTIDVTGGYKVCYILAGSETLVAFLILLLPPLRNSVCRRKQTLYKTETTSL